MVFFPLFSAARNSWRSKPRSGGPHVEDPEPVEPEDDDYAVNSAVDQAAEAALEGQLMGSFTSEFVFRLSCFKFFCVRCVCEKPALLFDVVLYFSGRGLPSVCAFACEWAE